MTKHSATFEVIKRTKPEDYVYTEEELKLWEKLDKKISVVPPTKYGISYNKEIDTYGVLLDFPCDISTFNFSLKFNDTGTTSPSPSNPREYVSLPQRITLEVNTEYNRIPAPIIEFNKPFYSGTIHWTKGYYEYTRTKMELDVSKLKHITGTSYVYTSIAEQEWKNFFYNYRTSTISNCLTYSTKSTVKDRFQITNQNEIVIMLDVFANIPEDEWLDEAKRILSEANCYFIYSHLGVKVEMDSKLPEIFGATADDDNWLSAYIVNADDDSGHYIEQGHAIRLQYRQDIVTYIDEQTNPLWESTDELEQMISALSDRIDELEANL